MEFVLSDRESVHCVTKKLRSWGLTKYFILFCSFVGDLLCTIPGGGRGS